MTLHINRFFTFSSLAGSAAGVASLALVAGTSLSVMPAAVAQDATDEDDVEYEWEPGEGKHVEEWYDPSDWFNQDDVTDYEELDDWDYDGYSGTASDFDYDAYYDGYYDGYFDDSFGYDNWEAAWDPGYAQYYTSGYYDGYYDAQTGYEFDAYYYVFDRDSSADGEASDRERAGDEMRERGDRQKGSSSSDAAQKRPGKDAGVSMDKADDLMAVKQRLRGTVTRITLKGREEVRGEMHTMGQLGFANGTSLKVDFGPYVNSRNLSIDPGDVITIVGERVERDDETLMRVNRLTHSGVVYRFAGPKRDVLKKDMKGGDAKTWGDEDKKPETKDGSGDNSGN